MMKVIDIQNHAARFVLRKPGTWAQRHCSEHSTVFWLRLGSNSKSIASGFSVIVRTICHHIFLTFEDAALCGHLCWQLLASLLRSWGKKDPSLFLNPLSRTLYRYPSKKSISQFTKKQRNKNKKQPLSIFDWCLLSLLLLVCFLWPLHLLFPQIPHAVCLTHHGGQKH